ncbi:hypothetical protein E1301_Tti013972 [Triplophysa tibetana]|uniref:Uncharacterized protein n=1 Tax=Triplophysa tibetana TaxID=1572043 RepID=A0A5A9N9N6_9TELE|nr:hypothetical protein E1301_Tti013972 [Triplophysa tibetana]
MLLDKRKNTALIVGARFIARKYNCFSKDKTFPAHKRWGECDPDPNAARSECLLLHRRTCVIEAAVNATCIYTMRRFDIKHDINLRPDVQNEILSRVVCDVSKCCVHFDVVSFPEYFIDC